MINKQSTLWNEKFKQDELRDMIAHWVGDDRVPVKLKIITDTSDFFSVDYDDIVILGERPYLIRNYEREGRFGIDDEPKFWVKRAVDLTNGEVKIIKLVFLEKFRAKVGDLIFDCVRSPKKEARILDIVRGHRNFMQGFAVRDLSGNIIRIIDYIRGKTFADYVYGIGKDHEEYFHSHFRYVLDEYIELVEAIRFLHEHGEKHGDIRRDHIIRDKMTGKNCWIDFDFNYLHKENIYGYDLFGLGNILVYLAGRGDITLQQLKREGSPAFERLVEEDLNIIFNNRVVNLKKVYPYIPDALNIIMLHFSVGAAVFYDEAGQLLGDLHEARDRL
ncbi:MAG: hypothetical protein AB1632_09200 [Nitrospirota bacterium]